MLDDFLFGVEEAHAIAQCRRGTAPWIAVEYRDIGADAARLLHCIQKTQPVFEFTAQSVVASSMANRCLLKYILIGGDGPSRSPLDSG